MQSRLLCILMLSSLLCSCSGSFKVKSQVPTPLIQPMPLTVGTYYPKELRQYRYEESNEARKEWKIEQGDAQMQMFSQVLAGMFENVVDLNQQQGAADLILTPRVEEFQYTVPRETRSNIYEVWFKYHLQLHEGSGRLVADWFMTSYGKTPTAFATSDAGGLDLAIQMALRDSGAKLLMDFSRVPEIRQWMEQNLNKSTLAIRGEQP
ncbi:hypothetical protein GCM10009092_15090 [Bowmanella denitrificans]|uniref:Lipoprotein n=1 Tax=Bowmanella denitrificans TaxID=366582 RepID=A0ABN0X092_9ALTE